MSANSDDRSGTGLRPGFEGIVKPTNNDGKALMRQGWFQGEDGVWEKRNSR
jgi:hypothetical protein